MKKQVYKLIQMALFSTKVCIIFLSLGGLIGSTQAQQSSFIPTIQSPDVVGLGRFVELPVGHHTGIPQISIPLYNIEYGGLNIPLSLSYHAGGMKVNEIPGSVGAGWSLNSGGMITRVTKGFPDDDASVVHSYKPRVSQGMDQFSVWEREILIRGAANFTDFYLPHYKVDLEYDVYYFNFAGFSGKFTFNGDGKSLVLDGLDLKVELVNTNEYKITDAQGNVYWFETKDFAYRENGMVPAEYVLTWHLSRIVSPSGSQINFGYNKYSNTGLYPSDLNQYAGMRGASHSYKFRESVIGTGVGPRLGGFGWEESSPQCEYPEMGETSLLKDITWNGNEINLHGSLNRLDAYKYKLDSINIKRGNALLRQVKFNYGYMDNLALVDLEKKLRLDSIKIDDGKYSFNYYGAQSVAYGPPPLSQGSDYWGYYNGSLKDNTTIPGIFRPHEYKLFSDTQFGPTGYGYLSPIAFFVNRPAITFTENGDKNPDFKFAVMGTLSEITYPTGGKTMFEFEGNDFSDFSFTSQSRLEDDPRSQFKLDSIEVHSAKSIITPYENMPEQYNHFVVHYDQMVSLEGVVGMPMSTTYQEYMDVAFSSFASISVEKYNQINDQFERVDHTEILPFFNIGFPAEQDYEALKHLGRIAVNKNIHLPAGRYRIKTYIGSGWVDASMSLVTNFSYKKNVSDYAGPGLRIKKISFKEGNETLSEKTFEYKTADGKSSGVLESPMGQLGLSFRVTKNDANGQMEYFNADYCGVSNDVLLPLGLNARLLGYSRVTEKMIDNGKIIHHFKTGIGFPDFFSTEGDISAVATPAGYYGVIADLSVMRGLEDHTETFDKNGVLVKEQFIEYTAGNFGTSRSAMLTAVNDQYGYSGFFKEFTTNSVKSFLFKDSTVFHHGSTALHQVNENQYDFTKHQYPKVITQKKSDGSRLITKMTYPSDYSPGASPTDTLSISIKRLLDSHVISSALEKYVQRNDPGGVGLQTVSAELTVYHQDRPLPLAIYKLDNVSGLSDFAPLSVSSSSSVKDSRYIPVLYLKHYDEYGNLLEAYEPGKPADVYVWGHGRQYLLAKVTGSDRPTVSAMLNQTILDSGTEVARQAQLNSLRGHFANNPVVQVNTYTHQPLVGVRSQTDAKGMTSYYHYDSFQRLKHIKDQNGNIIRSYDYHYRP